MDVQRVTVYRAILGSGCPLRSERVLLKSGLSKAERAQVTHIRPALRKKLLVRAKRSSARGFHCYHRVCSSCSSESGVPEDQAEMDLHLDAAIPGFTRSGGKGAKTPSQLDITAQGHEPRPSFLK